VVQVSATAGEVVAAAQAIAQVPVVVPSVAVVETQRFEEVHCPLDVQAEE